MTLLLRNRQMLLVPHVRDVGVSSFHVELEVMLIDLGIRRLTDNNPLYWSGYV